MKKLIFPKKMTCPHCDAHLVLSYSDRKLTRFACPSCNTEIDKYIYAQAQPQSVPQYRYNSLTERVTKLNDDYFNFRSMVTPNLMTSLYVLVAIIINIGGLFLIAFVAESDPNIDILYFIGGLLLLLLLNIIWRILCEFMIILFSIHDRLREISDNSHSEDISS